MYYGGLNGGQRNDVLTTCNTLNQQCKANDDRSFTCVWFGHERVIRIYTVFGNPLNSRSRLSTM